MGRDAVNPPALTGADAIVRWWGEWIGFHDFYLLTVPAEGDTSGELRIHGWVTDWNKTDDQGYFIQSNHCVVTIAVRGIRSRVVDGEDLPAIIFGLVIEPSAGGWAIRWDSSWGMAGEMEVADAAISLHPGEPSDSEANERLNAT